MGVFLQEERPRRCPNIEEIIQALQGIFHVLFLKFPSFFNMLEGRSSKYAGRQLHCLRTAETRSYIPLSLWRGIFGGHRSVSRSKKSWPLKKGKKILLALSTRLAVNSHSTSIFQVLFWRQMLALGITFLCHFFFLLKLGSMSWLCLFYTSCWNGTLYIIISSVSHKELSFMAWPSTPPNFVGLGQESNSRLCTPPALLFLTYHNKMKKRACSFIATTSIFPALELLLCHAWNTRKKGKEPRVLSIGTAIFEGKWYASKPSFEAWFNFNCFLLVVHWSSKPTGILNEFGDHHLSLYHCVMRAHQGTI